MPSIRIPESAYEALRSLAGLTEAQFAELLDGLSKSQPGMSMEAFCEHVALSVKPEDAAIAKQIVGELFRLDALRGNLGVNPTQLAEMIYDAAIKEKNKDVLFPKETASLLANRITKIFECSYKLSLTAKVSDVSTEHSHVFFSARVFTDIRPIFTEDATSIDAAVLIHHLVIHYGENNDHKDFNVALDASDVQSLRQVLDRADKKAALLRELVDKSKVVYIHPEH